MLENGNEDRRWKQLLKEVTGRTGPWAEEERLVDGLMEYINMLMSQSDVMNLVSYRSAGELVYDHILDSLWGLRVLVDRFGVAVLDGGVRFADVGSGAGFPGIIYALASGWQGALVESIRKRCGFLTECVKGLGLEKVMVVSERVEVIGRDPAHREKYDVAVVRAVGPVATLLELCGPLVRCGGVVELFKGPRLKDELERGGRAASEIGLAHKTTTVCKIGPQEKVRCYAVFGKVAPTPERYPRRVGVPRKRPL